MPERYRCDSCKAVMFHLDAGLRKRQPKSRRLKQWEYTDVFDDVCKTGFEGYGIKLIDGENALSGPGLPRDESLAPGSGAIQMSSESWSKRLGEICRKTVYEELGEEETYEYFYSKFTGSDEAVGLSEGLCRTELRQCTAGPKPPKATEEPAKEEKPKKGAGKDKAKDKAKAEKKKAKAEKEKAKAEKAKKAAELARDRGGGAAAAGLKIDAETFLRDLAARHGHAPGEYAGVRTEAEWEKTIVAIAGRIFGAKSEL
uniref:DUF3456 domain-containing protein n=1 Tax=Zooxanthella nutricula TaxID=1333877 RepID=A0A7S2Q7N2_9DINO